MILRYDQGMNTHPEPIDPNRPAVEDIAREVLAAEKVMDDTPGLLYLDGPTHEHEKAAGAILTAAPDLAHAVIAAAAKVERVEALAETWEEAARLVEARGGDAETVRDLLQDIRDALNGENA